MMGNILLKTTTVSSFIVKTSKARMNMKEAYEQRTKHQGQKTILGRGPITIR